eukprot:SAG11_NODE_1128_length_5762_cov_2.633763_5_plen_55_part_00
MKNALSDKSITNPSLAYAPKSQNNQEGKAPQMFGCEIMVQGLIAMVVICVNETF